jgi:Zn-dependent peptidase ImmA (M78 family)
MVNSYFEEKAEKLLIDADCFRVPVDINKCAAYLNVKVEGLTLEDNVSGFFINKDNSLLIGYNVNESPRRKNFTIAHELAHYVLHAKDSPLFIDKNNYKLYRDTNSSSGEIIKEIEANAFAAALLMPKKLITEKMDSLSEENKNSLIKTLANFFVVSPQAMGIRLVNLGIIDYY